MRPENVLAYCLVLLLAPLVPGVVNRTKAFFAGRQGQSVFQLYYDLWRLLWKTPVYSKTTTWIFRFGPVLGLSVILAAYSLFPQYGIPSLIIFPGDFLLFFYLLALARFFTVVAALDTGSAFEGMGASREVFFGALIEIAVFLGLSFLVILTGETSFTAALGGLKFQAFNAPVELILVVVSMFFVLLTENCRIPVDDPNTHLELTMIHEVMVLDHSGPEFFFIQYAAALKLTLYSMLFTQIALPIRTPFWQLDLVVVWSGVVLVAVAVGIVESTTARSRMPRVAHFIAGAWTSAALGLILLVVRSY